MSTRHPSVATRTTRAAAPIGRPIPPERQLGRVLKLPVLLILAGIAVSAIHQIVNWATGFTVEVGALRVWMFAGALVGAGILLLMWRLAFANTMRPPSDEI